MGHDADSSGLSDNPPDRESYLALFLRFLKFGLLAWGGPVAQIARLRDELVEKEGWISSERFNRVLAVYQALPGPEATELCVYFGLIRRDRWGGLLAGLGFVLPGLLLMMFFSWLYVSGASSVVFSTLFLGMQPAVIALIFRAVHRIGSHAMTNVWLFALAVVSLAATLFSLPFYFTLSLAGIVYTLRQRSQSVLAVLLGCAAMIFIFVMSAPQPMDLSVVSSKGSDPTLERLGAVGLKAGLLTFGGAYTVIPFLQQDTVGNGWITNAQFLDGIALSGILPSPLVIVGAFIGFLTQGWLGALILTAGIFLPAFGFTLIGHDYLEKVVENRAMHAFLDGVTAGVVGMIAATALLFIYQNLRSPYTVIVFGIGLLLLYRWKSKAAIPAVVLGAGLAGWVVSLFA